MTVVKKEKSVTDISILNITSLILKGKQKVLGVISVSLLICSLYLYFSPEIFVGTVKINLLSVNNSVKIKELNRVFLDLRTSSTFQDSIASRNSCKDIFKEINRDSLRDQYINLLKNGNFYKDVLVSEEYLNKHSQVEIDKIKKILNTASFSSKKSNTEPNLKT